MIASYRDPRYAASLRLEHLRERFQERSEGIPSAVLEVHVRRAARSWAGGVAVAGFVAMTLITGLRALGGRPWDAATWLHPTLVLISAGVLAIVTYFVARRLARRSFPKQVMASFDGSADELARLARFEGDAVHRAAARLVDASERRSLWLPIAGIGLLAPLSTHLVVWMLICGDLGGARWLDKFDGWIGLSLVLVGLAHVAVAGLGFYFASQVRKASTCALALKNPLSGWTALGLTVAASLVPGVILFAIPPILVFITALPVIPALFGHMYRSALDERAALDVA